MNILNTIAAGAVALAASCGAALAADLSAPQDPGGEAPMVELGTGWYLRGDGAWARDSNLVLDAFGLASKKNGTKNGWMGDLGFGYSFNQWFRADATFEFRNQVRQIGNSAPQPCLAGLGATKNAAGAIVGSFPVFTPCFGNYRDRITRMAVLGNAYLELGTWSSLTPYVGAGIGFARNQSVGNVKYYITNGDRYDLRFNDPFTGVAYHQFQDIAYKQTKYALAWALMAGVAVDIAPHAKLDVGYRYADFGTLKAFSPNQAIFVNKKVQSQEVRAGIRYMID